MYDWNIKNHTLICGDQVERSEHQNFKKQEQKQLIKDLCI